jgi:hypothetical protein
MASRDDVIRMAREAEGQEIFANPEEGRALFYMDMDSLERFAQLVAAQAAAEEREACAKACEDYVATWQVTGRQYATAIRNRGTA